jgi:hypothetical protein
MRPAQDQAKQDRNQRAASTTLLRRRTRDTEPGERRDDVSGGPVGRHQEAGRMKEVEERPA